MSTPVYTPPLSPVIFGQPIPSQPFSHPGIVSTAYSSHQHFSYPPSHFLFPMPAPMALPAPSTVGVQRPVYPPGTFPQMTIPMSLLPAYRAHNLTTPPSSPMHIAWPLEPEQPTPALSLTSETTSIAASKEITIPLTAGEVSLFHNMLNILPKAENEIVTRKDGQRVIQTKNTPEQVCKMHFENQWHIVLPVIVKETQLTNIIVSLSENTLITWKDSLSCILDTHKQQLFNMREALGEGRDFVTKFTQLYNGTNISGIRLIVAKEVADHKAKSRVASATLKPTQGLTSPSMASITATTEVKQISDLTGLSSIPEEPDAEHAAVQFKRSRHKPRAVILEDNRQLKTRLTDLEEENKRLIVELEKLRNPALKIRELENEKLDLQCQVASIQQNRDFINSQNKKFKEIIKSLNLKIGVLEARINSKPNLPPKS